MTDRLQGIEVFVAAVEAGSFARAASRLHLTRSAVAKAIARLESRLNQRLFHRTTRNQVLTDEGQLYYVHARRAIDAVDAAGDELQRSRETVSGRVRITMPELLGRRCVAPLLLTLGRQYPELVLNIHMSDQRLNLVEEGLDLALRSGPLEDSSSLIARPVGLQRMGVFAAPSYVATHPRLTDMQALMQMREEHSFISYARDSWVQPWTFRSATGQTVVLQTSGQLVCNSLEVGLAAAEAGMGLVRLPSWLAAPAICAGTLAQVFLEPQPFCHPLHLLWPRVPTLSARLRLVIDTLARELPPLIESR